MDLLGKLTGGQNAQQQTGQPGQAQAQSGGGGGFMGMLNNAAGGGQQGEAKEGELSV